MDVHAGGGKQFLVFTSGAILLFSALCLAPRYRWGLSVAGSIPDSIALEDDSNVAGSIANHRQGLPTGYILFLHVWGPLFRIF